MNKTAQLIKDYIEYLLEATSPEAPIWNIEKIRLGKDPSWNYIDGCMIKAVLELYNITGNEKFFRFADNFVDFYISEDGSIRGYSVEEFNIDNINEGKVLFPLYKKTRKEKYKLALDLQYSQLVNHPRTKTGNFWHKQIYPHQIWLDGLYMAQPFYMEYDNQFNQGKNYNDIFDQFENVFRLLKDSETGLYYHAYDDSKSMFWCDKETGLSANFWLRALGWFTMAMVDVLELCDTSISKGREETIKTEFRALADALIRVQDRESGMWYQVVDKPEVEGNYLETSGSAILSYAFLKAVRLGILPESYRRYGELAFDGICDTYLYEKDDHLNLGGICLMAGLGGSENRDGSIEYYLSEPIVENEAKGVAPFLLAYTEIVRFRPWL